MNSRRLWSTTSRRLSILLVAVVLPPAATLIWLGAQLLEQDRDVIVQRERDRRTAVGEAVAQAMRESLAGAERLFDGGAVPDGIVRFVLSNGGIDVTPPTRLLWTAVPRQLRPAEEELFAESMRLEYQGDLAGALHAYSKFAHAPDHAVRAGALRRIARVHWREHRWDEALAAYRSLTELTDISDVGMPADLLARRKAGDVLEAAGRADELTREAERLRQDLLASTWSLDRDSWELVVRDLERWRGARLDIPADRQLFSGLADALWRQFREDARGPTITSPQRLVEVDGVATTVLARPSTGGLTIIALSPTVLDAWANAAVAGAFADDAMLGLVGVSGRVIAGTYAPSGIPIVRLNAPDNGLPWTLTMHSNKWSEAGEQFAYRRRLLSIGLASVLLLFAGGSYFLWRVVQRELAVSRLQTDFVAAVSHEFRTPLTSLRHITELLEEDDDMPVARRRSFYEVYRRNTERLHRLVESLLDFARMEAGRKAYELRPIDAEDFATHVVAEFQRHVGLGGSRVELDIRPGERVHIQGDRAALTNALWNLLDNAVKYSPDGGLIHVSVGAHPSGVAIAVRDGGLGIARHERDAIFQRFVRGKQALALGIKGTGLGLAMVAHIARAHGGDIEVESGEGQGSTFRLVLPAAEAAAEGAPRYEPA